MKVSSHRFARIGMLALSMSAALSVLTFQIPGVAKALSATNSASSGVESHLRSNVPFGVYDPYGQFRNERGVAIEHVFLPWEDVDVRSLHEADSYALERGRELLVTIEPWSWSPEKRIPRPALATGIVSGLFDENIRRVCGTVSRLKSRVTVRWAHEMDDTSGRYTWSLWEPRDYISAYRHLVDVCQDQAPNVVFMWSVKGEGRLNAYYPGDEYVDVVGLSIFGLQEYDLDKFGRGRTFDEVLRATYDRLTSYRKPIYIAELGIHGDDEYIRTWWDGILNAGDKFPSLKAIVYFNEIETYPWPEHYARPDWRVRQHTRGSETH